MKVINWSSFQEFYELNTKISLLYVLIISDAVVGGIVLVNYVCKISEHLTWLDQYPQESLTKCQRKSTEIVVRRPG